MSRADELRGKLLLTVGDVCEMPFTHLWGTRITSPGLTLVAGADDDMQTLLCAWLAARFSNGEISGQKAGPVAYVTTFEDEFMQHMLSSGGSGEAVHVKITRDARLVAGMLIDVNASALIVNQGIWGGCAIARSGRIASELAFHGIPVIQSVYDDIRRNRDMCDSRLRISRGSDSVTTRVVHERCRDGVLSQPVIMERRCADDRHPWLQLSDPAPTRAAATMSKAMWVYVVGSDLTRHVKIGCSTDVPKRLKSLQTGNPGRLYVLAQVSGDRSLEEALHAGLARYRGIGEWFDFRERDPLQAVEEQLAMISPQITFERLVRS